MRRILALLFVLGGCSAPATYSMPPTLTPSVLSAPKITHIIIVIQENRTPDNLFRGLPGADSTAPGLHPLSLVTTLDIRHSHPNFIKELTNGFPYEARTYVPRHEVEPYFELARQYTFADRMFQSNAGPSFPAHQYLIRGTSTPSNGSPYRAAENPTLSHTGGCDSPSQSVVALIDPAGIESRSIYPCFEATTLTDLLDAHGITWKYYQANIGAGVWNGLDAIRHIRDSAEYPAHVITPSPQVLTDIAEGHLASVSWVTPAASYSDHAGMNNGTGPSWVAAIVNTVGESRYWDSTEIFEVWDDWGGWYDHVKPPQYNSYELGFRVPMLVISPYAKRGYVSHVQYEFGSILKFTEATFDLGSLGTTDVRANNPSDCFDLSAPHAFRRISAPLSASYFLHLRDTSVPDDD